MAKTAPSLTDRAPPECCPASAKLRPAVTRPYARLFKAMGDETRLEMLALLAAAGAEMCVCDIEGHFDLSQPTISHHLKILREAQLVTAERRGTWVYYSLERGAIRLVQELCATLLR